MISGVLLLNASYEPLTVLSLYRAICLVVDDKAEIIKGVAGKKIRSQYLELEYPSVVRLKRYVKVPFHKYTALNTRTVLARDRHKCAYCGKRAESIDHIHPISRGGKNNWMNVVAACKRCNTSKSDRHLSELGWKLQYKPTMPPPHHWFIIGWAERKQWEEYIDVGLLV